MSEPVSDTDDLFVHGMGSLQTLECTKTLNKAFASHAHHWNAVARRRSILPATRPIPAIPRSCACRRGGQKYRGCSWAEKACLLQNHGLLTTGETTEAAVFWFMSLEKCCHAQLLAEAAGLESGRGGPIEIDEENAQFTLKSVGQPSVGVVQCAADVRGKN